MAQYVAAYDIQDDTNRERVADLLWQFGTRIQRSVFVVEVSLQDLAELQADLGPLLGEADLMDFIPIDGASDRPHYRWQADLGHLDAVSIVA